jgi:hypothetical protein
MFNGLIDSRGVQRGSSSSSSAGGSSSRQRRTTSDAEIESLRREVERRDAFLKAQAEYQAQQQAYQEYMHEQQMAMMQVSMNVNDYHSYHYHTSY